MSRAAVLVLAGLAACRAGEDPTSLGTDPSDPTDPITDTAVPGTAADLASLELSGVPLSPSFAPGRSYYAVMASQLPAMVSVDAVPLEDDAEVVVRLETVDGSFLAMGEELSVSSGQRIRIDVVSGDGVARRTYSVGVLPDDFPRPYVEGTASAGWTFLATRSIDTYDRFVMAVDDKGTPGWWRRVNAHDARVTADGRISFYGFVDGASGPRNLVLSEDLAAWDVNLGPGSIPAGWSSVQVDEHEWDVQGDGTANRITLGKVLEDTTPWGGSSDHLVEHQKAQHVDLNGNILFEWSTQGLLPYDLLPPNLADDIAEPDWEPFHINSIAVDPEDGHWVMSLQRVSLVIKVARHGPQQGEVLWKLSGGQGSDITIVDDVRPSGWVGFAGQHDVRVTGPNRISMYDAGLGDSRNVGDARYVEYELDLDSMEARIVEQHVWEGWGNGKAGGTAQHLPSGGVLIGFGSLTEGDDGTDVPIAMELSPDGEEVWSLWAPGETWSYRAWRQYGDPLQHTWSRTP
jgi:hypothetical protein